MPILLNIRHELFVHALFKGMTGTAAAIEAGYKPSRARETGYRLATYGHIIDRIAELGAKLETETVMPILERMERLSEIARARLSDFIEINEDGSIQSINIKGLHNAALQEVTVTEFSGGRGQQAKELSTRVRLHDPVRPIAEMNKMDKLYTDSPIGNVDNRTINIIVTSERAKELTDRILDGEGTD